MTAPWTGDEAYGESEGPSPGSEIRSFQRRGFLAGEFPQCNIYVINCCANDAADLNFPETYQLMVKKFLPMHDKLLAERRELVDQLSKDPPRYYSEEPASAPAEAKKEVKKKKSRLQGGGTGGAVKPKAKTAPSGGAWEPKDDKQQRAVARPLGGGPQVDVIRPGLVLMKNILPMEVQQHFVDVSVALGTPTNGVSGGWYRVDDQGKLHWNSKEGWGQMSEDLRNFPPQYRELCVHYLAMARQVSDDLPDMDPNLVLLNFYPPDRPGIYWHRDNSRQERRAVELGLPVVSFSIGDSAVFAWKLESHTPEQELVLNSGDVLVFGGPSRLIHHAVPKVYGNSAPKQLSMPKGRLNLTFRSQGPEGR